MHQAQDYRVLEPTLWPINLVIGRPEIGDALGAVRRWPLRTRRFRHATIRACANAVIFSGSRRGMRPLRAHSLQQSSQAHLRFLNELLLSLVLITQKQLAA